MYSKEQRELERARIRNINQTNPTPSINDIKSTKRVIPNKPKLSTNKKLCVMRYNNNSLLKLIEYIKGTDNIGVEFGSYDGGSAETFLNSNKFKLLYCVDGWMDSTSLYNNEVISNINDTTTNATLAEIEFDKRMSSRDNCVKVKKLSYDAYDMFEDNSLDFVYIDSNHSYESVVNDITHMLSKVKNGGILSGHDYDHPEFPGVKKAVDELLKNIITFEMEWVYRKE